MAYFKGEQEQRICKQCGKTFYVYVSTLNDSNTSGNFCSRPCYNEYQKTITGKKNNNYTRVKHICPSCSKEFEALPSKIKTYKNVFCSSKCKNAYMFEYIGGDKNANWRGGASNYRGNFESVKRKLFPGRQYCAICGTSKNIHIHHIIPYRLTQDNSAKNLIPLCNRHHKQFEEISVKFIDLFDDGTYEVAKRYLNLLLRSRQFETYALMTLLSPAYVDDIIARDENFTGKKAVILNG